MTAASDKAYRALRERIVSGAYVPGSRLKERQVCSDLAVSRTPVREALRRLETEGLVTIEPRRGAVVTEIDQEEAAEIFALGAVIESFAAGLAARKAGDDDVRELETLIAEMARVLEPGDAGSRGDYMVLDSEFHAAIVALAGSRRLGNALQQVVGVPVLVQAFHRYSRDDLRQSLEQHRAIAAAIRARDPQWAESAMRAHILSGRAVMLSRAAPL